MNELLHLILLTLLAGITIPAGALLAYWGLKGNSIWEDELRHGIVAFGGGALLAAVALVLVPEGAEQVSMMMAVVCFVLGGVVFMWVDVLLARSNSPMSQMVAMLSDFIPEALALGAALAVGSHSALLLALIMALQNLPEGFNAFREMTENHPEKAKRLIVIFTLIAFVGPVCGVLGYFLLSQQVALMSGIMLFASGGILYIIFQDIAPQVPMQNRWLPPLGAIAGFALGLGGAMMVH